MTYGPLWYTHYPSNDMLVDNPKPRRTSVPPKEGYRMFRFNVAGWLQMLALVVSCGADPDKGNGPPGDGVYLAGLPDVGEDPLPPGKSAEGESCGATSDCGGQLRCIAFVCQCDLPYTLASTATSV
jgi:EB module.